MDDYNECYYYRTDLNISIVYCVSLTLLVVFLFTAAVLFMIFQNSVRKFLISLSISSVIYITGVITVVSLCYRYLFGLTFIPIIFISAMAIAMSEKSYSVKAGLIVSVPCLLVSIIIAMIGEVFYVNLINIIILIFEALALAVAFAVRSNKKVKKYMAMANSVAANGDRIANGAKVGSGENGESVASSIVVSSESAAQQTEYASDYAVSDDVRVREIKPNGQVDFTPTASKKCRTNKSAKSAKIQLAIIWLAPSIVTYLGVILCVLTDFNVFPLILTVIGILGSAVGAYIIGNNITGLFKIKPPQKSILDLKVGNIKFRAATGRKASSETSMQTRRMLILMLTLIWLVPVAAAGWLLFTLYCCKKFMRKLSTMAEDCDRADDIVSTRQASLEELAYYFYRMIDYAYVYIDIDERKASKEMLDRAENLLDVWTVLYPDV